MKKNSKIISFDLIGGIYEYVIRLTYGNFTKIYSIYGFSEYECTNNKNKFIKQWYRIQAELHDFMIE